MDPTTHRAETRNSKVESLDFAPDASEAQPRAPGMSHQGWILFGALAGGVFIALVAPFAVWGVRRLFRFPYTSVPWGTISMMVGGLLGLLAGGLLGSRAPGMGRRTRSALAGLGGAMLLATAGGFTGLVVSLNSGYYGEYDNHGMRDSLLGIAGAIGLGVAGAIGALILRGDRGGHDG